jgi:hypothetical protein
MFSLPTSTAAERAVRLAISLERDADQWSFEHKYEVRHPTIGAIDAEPGLLAVSTLGLVWKPDWISRWIIHQAAMALYQRQIEAQLAKVLPT